MTYTIQKLAQLAGVSARTLRYYDQIGLLRPERMAENDYRVYGAAQVDRLQQILFYRELGVGLDEIRALLDAPGYDRGAALRKHLGALGDEKRRLETLMENVRKTLLAMEGAAEMSDKEKFEGFKKELIEQNEKKYGKELRERFGDREIDASNARMASMSEQQYDRQKALENEIAALLKAAVATGDPSCADAQKACALHREWLETMWRKGSYTKQAHAALAESYVADERFAAYFENIAPGCAAFLRDAIKAYCEM